MNMKTIEACEVIQQTAPDAIYVTTMGAMNGMDKLEVDVLSVACVPLMGGAASWVSASHWPGRTRRCSCSTVTPVC
jgi:hypothetical protein